MDGNALGLFHTGSAAASLVVGAIVLLMPKGTRRHRRLGAGYFAAMVATNASALLVYHRTGHLGPFHVAAAFSALTLVAALLPVVLRKPGQHWIEMHYELVTWSYVGLLAAAAAEIAVRLPTAPFWGAVVAASAAIIVIGGLMIRGFRSRTIASVRHRSIG